uniref:Uncharacterized protein n=1 Tax=Zooxanthella nutricula TaxID=1333877 RepID=A0A7S2LHL6_9DINO|mmetsp:Transcript_61384/g.187493  ORF Transcript_61384/g.187493 Transcript_61384/m.187493 type:complete len:104 (+) Transcript_61384:42-353(+)
MKALAYANFEISHDYIRQQISKPEGVCKEIAILGGIMVNLPGELGDRFVPITFEALDCRTGRHENLFASLGLGQAAPHRFGSSELRRPFFEPHAAAIARAPGA